MSYYSRYDKGDWKAICDVCGREFKASQLNKRWDGLMCCKQDWEPRQPQDFVRGVADPQLVPWVRDEPTDSFIAITISNWFSWLSRTTTSIAMAIHYHLTPFTISGSVRAFTTIDKLVKLISTYYKSMSLTVVSTASMNVRPVYINSTFSRVLNASVLDKKPIG